MASSSTAAAPAILGQVVTEKLTKTNFVLWKAQVLAALRGAQLAGFLDNSIKPPSKMVVLQDKDGNTGEKVVNAAYTQWVAQEQQVLSYLLMSLSREVLTQVATLTRASEVWSAIEGIYASQSRARVINTRLALSTTKKGNLSISDYVGKMKSLADEMSSAGKPMDDEELVTYILAGLDFDYNSVVSSVANRAEPISVSELHAQLTGFESRMELLQGAAQSSANSASRGGRGGGGGGGGRGGPNGGNRGRGGFGRGGGGRGDGKLKPICQLCGKIGHTVVKCWKRFDTSYSGEEKSVAAATNSYGVDTNWYIDTGATDHITGELEKLTVRDKYTGGDQVHTASGTGMGIDHVGRTVIRTPVRDVVLRNVLHVPDAQKSLVSAHHLTKDNHAFMEVHPFFFLLKD